MCIRAKGKLDIGVKMGEKVEEKKTNYEGKGAKVSEGVHDSEMIRNRNW